MDETRHEQIMEAHSRVAQDLQISSGRVPTNWDIVQEQHRRIVAELNRIPVSFTARSAEGLAMYESFESHNNPDEVRELARAGHHELVARAIAAREAQS